MTELKTLNDLGSNAGLAGTARNPKFGEWMRGIFASEENPQRDGMYVETIRRTGRMNPGTFYRLTDGNGNFWMYWAKDTVFLPANVQIEARPASGASLSNAGLDTGKDK